MTQTGVMADLSSVTRIDVMVDLSSVTQTGVIVEPRSVTQAGVMVDLRSVTSRRDAIRLRCGISERKTVTARATHAHTPVHTPETLDDKNRYLRASLRNETHLENSFFLLTCSTQPNSSRRLQISTCQFSASWEHFSATV